MNATLQRDDPAPDPAARTRAMESAPMGIAKASLMAAAAFLYLWPLATTWGLVTGVLAAPAAYLLATTMHRRRFRLLAGLAASGALAWVGHLLSEWVRTSDGVLSAVSVPATIAIADAVLFACLIGGAVFALRHLSLRFRAAAVLESLWIVGAVVALFIGHQNKVISEPRWFADWTLMRGWEPTAVLLSLGLIAAFLSLALLLRRTSLRKGLLSGLAILVVGGAIYSYYHAHSIEPTVTTNGLGLTNQEQDKEGKEGKDKETPPKGDDKGDGGGKNGPPGDNPYKDDYSNDQPSPVALVVMRDDYDNTSQGNVLYFRQRVLSRYAQGRLQPATEGQLDRDVVSEFPRDTPVQAEPSQVSEHHLSFPTTMHLMVDHPQPVALTHAERLTLTNNPNPRTFVASYDVESQRLGLPYDRLIGRPSIDDTWDEPKREHYTALPDDPRYEALANIILRDVDPRFFDDDIMKALLLKRYLEKSGYYTLKETHKGEADPTASFLFGSLRGYCVHFAHAAVFLLRSQGIAARVALGYAVQTHKRSGGSSMLIMSSDAHAWPEIHVAGVGWVTFDIYPEASDQPPRPPSNRNLENMLGEMARDDKTGGKNPDKSESWDIPWGPIGVSLLVLLGVLLVVTYTVKVLRRLRPGFRGTLDRLADVGIRRRYGESRERFAARLAETLPTLPDLTDAHLRVALGGHQRPEDHQQVVALSRAVTREYRQNTETWRRLLGALNPVGWWFTR